MNCLYNKKELKDLIKITILIFLYRIVMDICYFSIIVPNSTASEGYLDLRNIYNYILSLGVIVLSAPFMKAILKSKFSWTSFTVLILYSFIYIPFTTFIYAGIFSIGFVVRFILYWIVIFYTTIYANKNYIKSIYKINLNNQVREYIVFIIVLFEISVILYIWITKNGQARIECLSI